MPRMWMTSGWLIALLSLSCGEDNGNDETDDADGTGDDTGDSASEAPDYGVFEDPTSGLTWMRTPAVEGLSQPDAVDFCDALELDGEDDWRLPTIDELRSLVRGCPDSELDGSCNAVDGMGTQDVTLDCSGCEKYQGPEPEEGCYWDAEINGLCMYYWSSSVDADVEENAWSLFFVEGAVTSQQGDRTYQVRCVRGEG